MKCFCGCCSIFNWFFDEEYHVYISDIYHPCDKLLSLNLNLREEYPEHIPPFGIIYRYMSFESWLNSRTKIDKVLERISIYSCNECDIEKINEIFKGNFDAIKT